MSYLVKVTTYRTTEIWYVLKGNRNTMSENILIDIIGPGMGLVSSIGCLITLNTFLKDLHKNLKQLLNTLFIHNIIVLTLACAMSGSQGTFICFARFITMVTAFTLTIVSMPILSYMRYYITWKTQNTESIDEKWLNKIIVRTYLCK